MKLKGKALEKQNKRKKRKRQQLSYEKSLARRKIKEDRKSHDEGHGQDQHDLLTLLLCFILLLLLEPKPKSKPKPTSKNNNIVIIANNPDFFNKYGKDNKCIEFINSCDTCIRIKWKSNHLFGNKIDYVVITKTNILFDIKKKQNTNIICRDNILNPIQKKKVNKFIDPQNFHFLKLSNYDKNRYEFINNSQATLYKIKDKKKKKRKKKKIVRIHTGHLAILHFKNKFPKSNIFLLGFNFSNIYISRKETRRTRSKKLDHLNDMLLKDILKNNKQVKIKNEF